MGVHVTERRILTVMLVLATLGGAIGGVVGAGVAVLTTPCAEEDSTNCLWDAETRGNGEGRSFLVFRLTDGGPDYTIDLN
jgi:hypothetical protein